jgi:hypothetical protein
MGSNKTPDKAEGVQPKPNQTAPIG